MPPRRSRFTSGDGSADRFVGLMNAKAEELGLSDTNFENPHGLDESGHVSSARDATALVRYALGVPFIRDALSRTTVSLPGGRTFPTTDDLLVSWAPLVGGKTGHTRDAGWSQAAAAARAGVTVYGTVLGSDTRGTRNDALRELLEYGLDQYRRVQVIDARRAYVTAETGYGQPDVDLVAPRSIVRTLRNGKSLVERVVAPTTLGLPVAKGQIVGRVEVYDGNRLVASSNLVAAESRRGRRFLREGPLVRDADDGQPLGDRVVIVTVTTNAALDRTLTVPVFQIGFRHRSSDVLTLAGGKGINVARALKILDVPVVATGLAGGRTGTRIIEELTAEAILNDFVRIAAESRTSTAVVDPTAGTHTEINEWGPEVAAGRARDARREAALPLARRRLRRPLRLAAAEGRDDVLRGRGARPRAPRRPRRARLGGRAAAARRRSRARSSCRRTSARPSSSSGRSSRTTTTS